MDIYVDTEVVEKLDELDFELRSAHASTIVFTTLMISVMLPMTFSCSDRKFLFRHDFSLKSK